MRRRLPTATAAVLLALGVLSLTAEQTMSAGRGICTAAHSHGHSHR